MEEEQAISFDLTEPEELRQRYQPTEDGEVKLRLDITSYQGIYHVILECGDTSLWGYSTVMETRQPPFTDVSPSHPKKIPISAAGRRVGQQSKLIALNCQTTPDVIKYHQATATLFTRFLRLKKKMGPAAMAA